MDPTQTGSNSGTKGSHVPFEPETDRGLHPFHPVDSIMAIVATSWKVRSGGDDDQQNQASEEGLDGRTYELIRGDSESGTCEVKVQCPKDGRTWNGLFVQTDARLCEVHVRCMYELEFSYVETIRPSDVSGSGMGRIETRPRQGSRWDELLLKLRPCRRKPDVVTIQEISFDENNGKGNSTEKEQGKKVSQAKKLVDSQMGDIRSFLEERRRQAEEEENKVMVGGMLKGNPMALILSAMSKVKTESPEKEAASLHVAPRGDLSSPTAEGMPNTPSEPTLQVAKNSDGANLCNKKSTPSPNIDIESINLLEKRMSSLEKVVYAALEGFNARFASLEEKIERALAGN